jgi:hypothetical protein
MDKENRQGGVDFHERFTEKSQQWPSAETGRNKVGVDITPEMVASGIDAFNAWYAQGGLDMHDLEGLVRAVLESGLRRGR